jgi:hypothetical protein
MKKAIFTFFIILAGLIAAPAEFPNVNISEVVDLTAEATRSSDQDLIDFFKSYWSAPTYVRYTNHFLDGEAPALTEEQYAILRENIQKLKIEPVIIFKLSIKGQGYSAIEYTESDNATVQRKIFLVKQQGARYYAVTEAVNRTTKELRRFLSYFKPEGLRNFDTVTRLIGDRISTLSSIKDGAQTPSELMVLALNSPSKFFDISNEHVAGGANPVTYSKYLYDEVVTELVPDLNTVSVKMLADHMALLNRVSSLRLDEKQQKQLVAYVQIKNYVGAASYIASNSNGIISRKDAVNMIKEAYGENSIFTFDSRRN